MIFFLMACARKTQNPNIGWCPLVTFFIALTCLCALVCPTWGSQRATRTTWGNCWLSSFTMWVSGVELRSSLLAASAFYQLSHPSSLLCMFSFAWSATISALWLSKQVQLRLICIYNIGFKMCCLLNSVGDRNK